MIGTIRPSWNNLKCLGLRDLVAQSMCRTCGSLATERTNFSRALLSYDTIFLSLFSSDENFTQQRLRARPLRCGTRFLEQSNDGRYLANVAVLTATTKVEDDVADGHQKLPKFMRSRVTSEKRLAADKLADMGLPIDRISTALNAYSDSEKHKEVGTFEELSAPIEEAYGVVLRHLPSKRDQFGKQMEQVGRLFGRLTLLVDAVEDHSDDKKDGVFNVWSSSTDLPQNRASMLEYVATEVQALKENASQLSDTAGSYVQAATEAVLGRLSEPKKRGVLMTHPASVLASCACLQQNCDGSYELTGTGMCFAAICGIGCIVCCAKD